MKFILKTAIITTLILICTSLTTRTRESSHIKATLQSYTPPAGLKNNSNSTIVDISIPGSNVLGRNDTKSVVEKNPFSITKCDQVLLFEAETVDLDNFMNKTDRKSVV